MEVCQLSVLGISKQKIGPRNAQGRVRQVSRESTVETPASAQSRNIEIDVSHGKVKIHSELELVCSAGQTERVRFLELICLLKLRQKIRGSQAAEASARCRLRNAATAINGKTRKTAAINRIVLHSENPNTRKSVQPEWILCSKRIVAAPTQPEFVQHSRTDGPVVADGRRMRFQILTPVCRRAGAINDSAEGTWNEPETVRVNVTHENMLMGIDLRVALPRVRVVIVDQRGNPQIVVRIERAAPRYEIRLGHQTDNFLYDRIKACCRNLVVCKMPRSKRVVGVEGAGYFVEAIAYIVVDVRVRRMIGGRCRR